MGARVALTGSREPHNVDNFVQVFADLGHRRVSCSVVGDKGFFSRATSLDEPTVDMFHAVVEEGSDLAFLRRARPKGVASGVWEAGDVGSRRRRRRRARGGGGQRGHNKASGTSHIHLRIISHFRFVDWVFSLGF